MKEYDKTIKRGGEKMSLKEKLKEKLDSECPFIDGLDSVINEYKKLNPKVLVEKGKGLVEKGIGICGNTYTKIREYINGHYIDLHLLKNKDKDDQYDEKQG